MAKIKLNLKIVRDWFMSYIKSFKNNNTLKFESVGLLGDAIFGITFTQLCQ